MSKTDDKLRGQTLLFAEAAPTTGRRRPIILDYFAGGGGASTGIEQALGRSPDVAINHCEAAVRMHEANHPDSDHFRVDVWDVDPQRHLPPGDVEAFWASPDCTSFSRAKGGQPVNRRIRGLAWIICRVAGKRRPRVIFMENVAEFRQWGPVRKVRSGKRKGQMLPVRSQEGRTFRKFVSQLEALGYAVEHRVLCAADYGAPTTRERLVLIARCDGQPIVWPTPTHGPGRPLPYRTAASCIDWSIPAPSIFDRARPLAENTMKRIAEGLRRFVIEDPHPFVVRDGVPVALATMVQTGYGENKGQAPRALDVRKPIGTLVSTGKHALVVAWIAKHYQGVIGHKPDRPLGTVTSVDHHSLCAAYCIKYYGQGNAQGMSEPLYTIVSKARFGLVTVQIDGETYEIVDIGLRMLTPRELARAQGFPESYQLTGTQSEQIARIGNSVSPPMARAVVAANLTGGAA